MPPGSSGAGGRGRRECDSVGVGARGGFRRPRAHAAHPRPAHEDRAMRTDIAFSGLSFPLGELLAIIRIGRPT